MAFEQRELADYLSSHLGARYTVHKLTQSFPGVSRETWLIEGELGGEAEGLVLRVDPPEGPSFPFPMKREWEIYRRLYGSEIPVAEPLWYEEGLAFAEGRPHMVRRLVEGSSTIAGLAERDAAGAELRRKVAFECVDRLAALHTLDWRQLGLDEVLPAPPSAGEAFRAELELWRDIWDQTRPEPNPVIEEAVCWMRENVPTDSPRISLVKGNNGVGEEIFRDGRIVAMSDWEGASLCDGLLDLFWSQGTLQLIDFNDTLGRYEERVGCRASIERLAFARLLIFFKMIVILLGCQYRNFASGRTKRIYGPSFVYSFSADVEHRLARCIGKSLTEAWQLIGPQERDLYSAMKRRDS